MIVEVGIKLNKDLKYYDNMLKQYGFKNDFTVDTYDIYYTNKSFDGMSENEIKNSCIRLRSCNDSEFEVQNKLLDDIDVKEVSFYDLDNFEDSLLKYGYKRIFDTKKKDYYYVKDGMSSKIQLQEIKDIGLLVYYDNPLYYDLPLEEQRKKLLDDLNLYGFNIKYDELGLDKLRTLYYKKEMFSKNQNG